MPMMIDKKLKEVQAHYIHACQKHPYFASEVLTRRDPRIPHNYAASLRQQMVDFPDVITGSDVLSCELWELEEAVELSDWQQAKYEAYDCIAVLLRMVDMIEQKESKR